MPKLIRPQGNAQANRRRPATAARTAEATGLHAECPEGVAGQRPTHGLNGPPYEKSTLKERSLAPTHFLKLAQPLWKTLCPWLGKQLMPHIARVWVRLVTKSCLRPPDRSWRPFPCLCGRCHRGVGLQGGGFHGLLGARLPQRGAVLALSASEAPPGAVRPRGPVLAQEAAARAAGQAVRV